MSKFDLDPKDEARLFHDGLRLFNESDWFEAHEVWEDIWHMASGEKKRFYQGLIQCAVTIEHLRRGNPRGALNVHQSALGKFIDLPPTYMGVNVKQLLEQIEKMIDPVRALPKEMFEPGKSHGLDLPVDLASAPKIALEYDPFAKSA